MERYELIGIAIDLHNEDKGIEEARKMFSLSEDDIKIIQEELDALENNKDRPASEDEQLALAQVFLELEEAGFDLDDRKEMEDEVLNNCGVTWEQYLPIRELVEEIR